MPPENTHKNHAEQIKLTVHSTEEKPNVAHTKQDFPNLDEEPVPSKEEKEERKKLVEAEKIARKEESDALERMEILGIENIDELIQHANVSPEQKKGWQALAKLDIPKDAKIKIVAVIGDPQFDQTRELPLIIEAMQVHHPNVTYACIDNQLPKKEKMVLLAKELHSPSDDIIIPFFSSHGMTESAERESTVAVNAPDDEFSVVSGYYKTESEILAKEDQAAYDKNSKIADEMLKNCMSSLIDPATHEIKPIATGTKFKVGDKELSCKGFRQEFVVRYEEEKKQPIVEQIEPEVSLKSIPKFKPKKEKPYTLEEKQKISEEQLKDLFIRMLGDKEPKSERTETDITMEELADLQEATGEKKQEWIYIFDNCFSGSATNDKIAGMNTTKAILASSSETEYSGHEQELKRGVFMNELFQMLRDGNTIGEAFVRTDLLLHQRREAERKKEIYRRNRIQNPKAVIRDGEKMIEVTSIEDQKREQMT